MCVHIYICVCVCVCACVCVCKVDLRFHIFNLVLDISINFIGIYT